MTVQEIYEQMKSTFAARSGMEPGDESDMAVRMYAVAAQMEALYLQAAWAQKQCFPQTASGTFLEYHARLRGMERKQGAPAEGVIRFSAAQASQTDLPIAKGTVCMTSGMVRFETMQEAVLKTGKSYVDVPACAVLAGSGGNVPAGTVTIMSLAPVGISSCGNQSAFAGGTDQESDEALRERVLDSYRRLPNGANAAYYEQEALSFDSVAAAKVVGRSRGIGTVDVVVATEAGIPSESLVEQIQDYFEQRREIAVDVRVCAPKAVTVNIAARIKVEEGRDAQAVVAAAQLALESYFTGRLLATPIRLAKLGSLLFNVPGVENYVITAPAADISIGAYDLPMAGSISVSLEGA